MTRPALSYYLTALAIALVARGLAAAAEKEEPLPTFEETCFQARPATSFVPFAEVQQMLAGVGRESHIVKADHEKARLKGLFRVRDWSPQTAVRLASSEHGNHLRIHVWGDGHGVSILLMPQFAAAYRTTHDPGEVASKHEALEALSALVATDDRRLMRLPHGPCQVRCQNGAVVVSVGSVRVLTVPLETPAQDLYIEVPYDITLQDLALLRTGPVPEEVSPVHRVVLDGKRPAELAWRETLPAGARFEKLADGCVELSTENTAVMTMAKVAVAGPGLYEVIAQIDDATPGAGIALLNAKDEPLEGIEFGREGKRIVFAFGNPQETPALGAADFGNRPVPLAGPRQWLRLVVAGGSSKCWVSGDGRHWGRAVGRAGPQRLLADHRPLRPRDRRSQKARQRGPAHPPPQPSGPRAGWACLRRRRGPACPGGHGRSGHEERAGGIGCGLERAHRPPGAQRFHAGGLALRLHDRGLGPAHPDRQRRAAPPPRRARKAERLGHDAGQDRPAARRGPRLAAALGRLPAAARALGRAWPRGAQRRGKRGHL